MTKPLWRSGRLTYLESLKWGGGELKLSLFTLKGRVEILNLFFTTLLFGGQQTS